MKEKVWGGTNVEQCGGSPVAAVYFYWCSVGGYLISHNDLLFYAWKFNHAGGASSCKQSFLAACSCWDRPYHGVSACMTAFAKVLGADATKGAQGVHGRHALHLATGQHWATLPLAHCQQGLQPVHLGGAG